MIFSFYDFQRLLGNKWTKIARELRGRSENDVKNRWHSLAFRKKYPYLARKRKIEEADEHSPDLLIFDLRCDTSTRYAQHCILHGSVFWSIHHRATESVISSATETIRSEERNVTELGPPPTDFRYTSFEEYIESKRSLTSSSTDSIMDLNRLSCSPFDLTPISSTRDTSDNFPNNAPFWDLFSPLPQTPHTPN